MTRPRWQRPAWSVVCADRIWTSRCLWWARARPVCRTCGARRPFHVISMIYDELCEAINFVACFMCFDVLRAGPCWRAASSWALLTRLSRSTRPGTWAYRCWTPPPIDDDARGARRCVCATPADDVACCWCCHLSHSQLYLAIPASSAPRRRRSCIQRLENINSNISINVTNNRKRSANEHKPWSMETHLIVLTLMVTFNQFLDLFFALNCLVCTHAQTQAHTNTHAHVHCSCSIWSKSATALWMQICKLHKERGSTLILLSTPPTLFLFMLLLLLLLMMMMMIMIVIVVCCCLRFGSFTCTRTQAHSFALCTLGLRFCFC